MHPTWEVTVSSKFEIKAKRVKLTSVWEFIYCDIKVNICEWSSLIYRHDSLLSRVLSSHPQIHIIDFDDENNMINKNVLLHDAGEIWHISASPADKGVLTTCYNKSEFISFYNYSHK